MIDDLLNIFTSDMGYTSKCWRYHRTSGKVYAEPPLATLELWNSPPPKPPVTVLPTRQQTIVGPRGRVQRRLSTATNCFRRFLPALGDLQLFNPRRWTYKNKWLGEPHIKVFSEPGHRGLRNLCLNSAWVSFGNLWFFPLTTSVYWTSNATVDGRCSSPRTPPKVVSPKSPYGPCVFLTARC